MVTEKSWMWSEVATQLCLVCHKNSRNNVISGTLAPVSFQGRIFEWCSKGPTNTTWNKGSKLFVISTFLRYNNQGPFLENSEISYCETETFILKHDFHQIVVIFVWTSPIRDGVFLSKWYRHTRKRKSELRPRMPYYWATGDSWELRPLN